MEPRHEEKEKPGQEPRPEPQPAKPRRFRVVKLEERIAPHQCGGYCGYRPAHPSEVVQKGDRVTCIVLSIDQERKQQRR
jgi:hypothetical protein